MPTPPLRTLLQFLKQAQHAHTQFITSAGAQSQSQSPIYVIGNPSVDLDSIISAIVYAYFAHDRLPLNSPRPHVPLINLGKVRSGSELGRLRPEFVRAFWHATSNPSFEGAKWVYGSDEAGEVLRGHVLTVEDFAEQISRQDGDGGKRQSADAMMVDWNAMPIRADGGKGKGKGCLTDLPTVDFSVLGCIDHHVDEGFLPGVEGIPASQPLVVQTAGSCTSLVVNTLRSLGLWGGKEALSKEEGVVYSQVAKLALASILIDTANLTDKNKVTKSDTDAVSFLQPIIDICPFEDRDQNGYYQHVFETKQNSLDLLTVEEILGRDFKLWTETSPGGEPVNIGFCSTVKSIPWIVQKAKSPQTFLENLHTFSGQHELDIVVVMSAFTCPPTNSEKDDFCRELLICALREGDSVIEALESFVSQSSEKLGLEEWVPRDGNVDGNAMKDVLHNDAPWRRIWVQRNVSQSRKQVAPLLRGVVAKL